MSKLWQLGTALLLLALPGLSAAIDPDEILDFDEAFRISGEAVSRDLVEISWAIEPDYYLYHNKFLKFATDTPGIALGEPVIPAGKELSRSSRTPSSRRVSSSVLAPGCFWMPMTIAGSPS